MKKIIIKLLFIAAMPLMAFSQFSISGKVVDKETKEPLQGAHIIIENTFKSTTSNSSGYYFIKKLKKGNYSIKVSFIGYKTFIKKIKLEKNSELNFEMLSSPVLEDEVIITATRAPEKSPTTYKNVSKNEIRDVNLGQDLPFLIETTPSTVVTSDAGAGIGYTSIRIRGTDMTRINVTINGIPLNDPESHGVFWVDMPDFASSVDNIQIQRGVGTSTNGAAAFGASINIQTLKLNPEPYAEINSSTGSFNTFKNNLTFGTGLIKGKFSFDGRISKITSDGYIDRAFSDLKSFFVSGAYYGEKSILKLNIFSGKEKTYQAWMGVPKDSLKTNRTYNPYTYDNETDNYQQDHYQLIYSKEINKNLLLNAALHYTHGKGYYEQYKKNRKFKDYLLDTLFIGGDTISRTNLVQQKWLDNDFYGFTYSLNYKKKNTDFILGGSWNKYNGDHFGKVIWAQFASNGSINHQWYYNTGEKTDFNIFGKINYNLNNKFNFYGDVQYRRIYYSIDGDHDDLRDITQEHKFNFLNPKAGLYFDINENHSTYFSFAVSNREPSRSDYRDSDEDHIPTGETLFDYELGYNFKSLNFAVDANMYYMNYKDQLILTGEINKVGNPIMTNVPKSYRAGIELAVGAKILQNLKWDINATFSRNKIKNFTAYIDNWSPPYKQITEDSGETYLSFSPDIIAGSIISYKPINNLNISFISKYVSRQYIDNTSNKYRSLDPYFVNNLIINYSFKTRFIKEIGFQLMINNIFNEKYETNAWVYRYYYEDKEYMMDGYFPQAGINFLAGINLRF
ncbi:MAG: TonB-dependent receptor [Bacteroidales bacterium]|nr:TonB-dependent receptor [Bacteroidales bacterium]